MITKEGVLSHLADLKQEHLYNAYAMLFNFLEKNQDLHHYDLFMKAESIEELNQKIIGTVRSFLNLQGAGIYTPILECYPTILEEQYPLEPKDISVKLSPRKMPIDFYLGVYNSYIASNIRLLAYEEGLLKTGIKRLEAIEYIEKSAGLEMEALKKRYPNHGWFRLKPIETWVRDVNDKFTLFPHEILRTPTAIAYLIEHGLFQHYFSQIYSVQRGAKKKTWRINLS